MSELKFDRDALLKRFQEGKPKLELVEVKGLGAIYLRRPNGEDAMAIQAIRTDFSKDELLRLPNATLAALMGAVLMRDENGAPFFATQEEGFKTLMALGADILSDLNDRILALSALDDQALENAEKKSSGDQMSEPGSISPSSSVAAP